MLTPSNFVKGMVLGVGGLGTRVLMSLALIPLIIKSLGTEMYGFYLFCISLMDLILMVDLGLNTGLMNRLTVYYSEDKPQKVQEQLFVGQAMYFGMGVVLFLIGYLLLPFLPGWFNLTGTLREIAPSSFLIILIMGSFTLYANYFQCVLLAKQYYHIMTAIDTAYLILSNVAAIILLLNGYGVVEILFARLILNFLKTGVGVWYGLKLEPHLLFPKSRFNMDALRDLFSISVYALISRIAGILVNRVDALVIATFLDMTAVAIYGIVVRMFSLVGEVVEKITMGGYALTTQLVALKDYASLELFYLRISCFCVFVMGTLNMWMLFNYRELFTYFSDGQVNIGATFPLVYIVIPVIWLSCLNIPACAYLFASERRKAQTFASVGASILNLCLSITLVKYLGIAGVSMGTLIPVIIEYFVFAFWTGRDLNISMPRFFKTVYFGNLVPWLACLLTLFGIKLLLGVSLLSMIAGGILAFSVAGFLWLTLTASDYEKDIIRTKIAALQAQLTNRSQPSIKAGES